MFKIAAGLGVVAASALFALSPPTNAPGLYARASLLGAAMLPMFGLAIAHANDLAEKGESVATNGGLLLLHGLGAVAGAFAGAAAISLFSPGALFIYIGAIYGAFALFTIFRIAQRAGAVAHKEPFAPVARGAAPTIFEIAADDTHKDNRPG